jgi:hypothetical protein
MQFKNFKNIFLGAVVILITICAGCFLTSAKTMGRLFYLQYPFFVAATILKLRSLIDAAIVVSAIILESYIVHRMLLRPCKFVVPRLFAINVVASIVQFLTFFCLCFIAISIHYVLCYFLEQFGCLWVIEKMLQDNMVTFQAAIFGTIISICLLYVRWKLFCKMFAWFDPKIGQVHLQRAMLYAVFASYVFLLSSMFVFECF